jgi:exopolysaccharide biosynthesis protein
MTNIEIQNTCDVLLKLGLVTKDKLQTTYPSIYPPNTSTATKGYRKIRMFDTDIHIYETSPDELVDVTLGQKNKLEKLSKIDDPNIKEICKMNCGFFNTDGSAEHLGLLIRNGEILKNYDNSFINFVYYKTGKTAIQYIVDNPEWINYWRTETYWVIGTAYCLIKDGKINTTNASGFSHSKSSNPRSMLGQLGKDGTFVLVVADGRKTNSKGLTAQEEAQVMLELGCVNAVNYDGGGSAELIVNDKIVNTPSDGCERSIGSSLFVYKK